MWLDYENCDYVVKLFDLNGRKLHMANNEYRVEAFEEYFRTTPAEVTLLAFRFAMARGLAAADAEDIAQETVLSMMLLLGKPEREEVRVWQALARGIAHRRVVDFFRTKSRTPIPHDHTNQALDSAHTDDTSSVEDNIVALANKVFAELNLSPRRRQVADMLWDPVELNFNAVPQAFVAMRLGIELGTIKATLSAIKAQFKAALAKELGR